MIGHLGYCNPPIGIICDVYDRLIHIELGIRKCLHVSEMGISPRKKAKGLPFLLTPNPGLLR